MKFQCRHLHHRQGDFSLEINLEISGDVIGIFGESGAGKTTFLEIVAGLRPVSAAYIAVEDLVLVDTGKRVALPPERRGFGYVPQDLALFPHLSVRKNLEYGRKTAAAPGINPAHVADVLGIETLLDRSIAKLSGGQKQRVAFARALLSSPRLLLLDEPLASLDQELKRTILPYLKRIRDEFKIPMLYVSHAPDEVAELCDQVIVLRGGKCIRTSAPAEIFEPSTSVRLRPGIYENGAEAIPADDAKPRESPE